MSDHPTMLLNFSSRSAWANSTFSVLFLKFNLWHKVSFLVPKLSGDIRKHSDKLNVYVNLSKNERISDISLDLEQHSHIFGAITGQKIYAKTGKNEQPNVPCVLGNNDSSFKIIVLEGKGREWLDERRKRKKTHELTRT